MIRLKNSEEIGIIHDAGLILAETLKEIGKLVGEGITTGEIDAFTRDYVIKKGGYPAFLGYHDYPASICISVNEEVIHGIPGPRKLAKGDIVGLDLGVSLKGFIADAAVTLGVDDIDPEAQRLIDVTKESLYLGIRQARAGNRIKDISEAVYTYARQHNYDVVRQYCGHGVGFEVHEDPQIMNYVGPGPNPRIKKGMVFAIEPMVNQGTYEVAVLEDEWTVVTADRKLSAHYEHTVAVLDDCVQILTTLDKPDKFPY